MHFYAQGEVNAKETFVVDDRLFDNGLYYLLFFAISSVAAMWLMFPKEYDVGNGMELFEEYNKRVQCVKAKVKWWFGFWMAGLISGGVALFLNS